MMAKLTFNRKPMPISAEYRPLYKISLLLMTLAISSRGKKSSQIRLQLFNWAIKNDLRRKRLLSSSQNGRLDIEVWGMDPALNVAIQFAQAEGMIERVGTSYKIKNKGSEFLKTISNAECFADEMEFFKNIGNNVTETMVNERIARWN